MKKEMMLNIPKNSKKSKKSVLHVSIITFISIVLMFVTLTGCGTRKVDTDVSAISTNATDKDLFEKAKSKIKSAPEKARMLFKEVMQLYPDSLYARRAKIGIADSYFKQRDSASYIMAATEYEEYVNLYPNSPDSVYAKFQVAMCYYQQMKKPGRDQTNTHQAVKTLENMIKQYPDTKEAEEAKVKLAHARQTLAMHYFNIGKSNYLMFAFKGAIVRFKQVMDDYPEFEHQDQLFYYAGMSLFKQEEYDSALSFYQKVINSFPKSKFAKKSAGMIKEVQVAKEMKPKKLQPAKEDEIKIKEKRR